jgi:DNA (cytosine-5)-methyltransferase 1
MSKLTVGALCAGYGGIELGLSALIETELKWFAEIENSSEKVIKKHFGDIPNLGDITELATTRGKLFEFEVPECDIITAGFPCQPVSLAGYRKGVEDERWLIEDVCRVASAAKAKWLILENVKGILTANNGAAMGRVCAEMARYGFIRWEWLVVRASDVGAAHRRERWFCVATNPNCKTGEELNFRDGEGDRQETRINWTAPDYIERFSVSGSAFGRYQHALRRWEKIIGRRSPAPHTGEWFNNKIAPDSNSERSEGQHTRDRLRETGKKESSPGSNNVGDRPGRLGKYKEYENGIRRWELVSGRLAPEELLYKHENGSTKVNPEFVEWMMGLPPGWVTDVGLSYTAQLELLGNGVVPQQATLALATLFRRLDDSKKANKES